MQRTPAKGSLGAGAFGDGLVWTQRIHWRLAGGAVCRTFGATGRQISLRSGAIPVAPHNPLAMIRAIGAADNPLLINVT